MKLRRVRSFGFKTFAEPTVLEFGDGITAIVGPNGSGKSNLVDAFRWVLGETSSKSLRGRALEDVIFSGNESRKPLGLAEVSILFDNADRKLPIEFAEVEITRRAYRVGESEYFINRTQVRLRDVVDLLMGTGLGPGSYAIVSQGQIDAILTSKPAERRALFEETAGIGKFLAPQERIVAPPRTHRAERDPHQRSHRRTRTPHSGARDADAARAPVPPSQHARSRPRDLRLLAREHDATRGVGRAARGDREERRAARRKCGKSRGGRRRARARSYAALSLRAANSKSCAPHAQTSAGRARSVRSQVRRRARAPRGARASVDADESGRRARYRGALVAGDVDRRSRRAHRTARERDRRVARARARGRRGARAAARGNLETIFTRLREVEAAAAEFAARKAERRVQAESLRAEAERLDAEERSRARTRRAARDRRGRRDASRKRTPAPARDRGRRTARRARARRGCRSRGNARAGRRYQGARRASRPLGRGESGGVAAAHDRRARELARRARSRHARGRRGLAARRAARHRGHRFESHNDRRTLRARDGRRVRRAALQRRDDDLGGCGAVRRVSQSQGGGARDVSSARHARQARRPDARRSFIGRRRRLGIRAHAGAHRAAIHRNRQLPGRQRADRDDARRRHRTRTRREGCATRS